VSKYDNCHYAGTINVAVKVMGMNARTAKPWGDLRKQTERVQTWHAGADCSKYGQQQQGRLDHWRWTAVFDRHSVTVGRIQALCVGVHKLDADICTQEEQAWKSQQKKTGQYRSHLVKSRSS